MPARRASDGEVPRAYVVARPGSQAKLTEDGVKKHMTERLAKYKQLEGGVVVVEAIPKTASGKILKRVLKEQAKMEMASEGQAKL